MRRSLVLGPVTAIVLYALLLALPWPAAADVGPLQNPHFPKPVALTPNIAFWKQVYTEHGVGDFVLHDRDNLGLIYEVVRVSEKANQARAEQLAKPEIDRARGKYREILLRLADGVGPEDLGVEGRRVAELWGCPCGPDGLRRAAENIRVQQGLRQKVNEGLQRAQKLLPQMVTILKRHDVPPELAALPLVESTFNPAAKSKAGAVGLWQFIKSTGKQYLTITRKRDDRRDPIRATEAAAHLLKNNYNTLGSWPLAIVAYNHGHAGIQAASTAVGSTAIEDIVAHYTGPRFGFASKNFYAEFLAALDVVNPLLGGHGKPLVAKGRRQQSTQQASISNQPPTSVAAPQATAVVPAPIDAAPAIEAPAAPAPAPRAEESSVSEQPLPDPFATPAPTEPATDAAEAFGTVSSTEQTVASESVSEITDLATPPTPPALEATDTPPPSEVDVSPHATTPPETSAAEPLEVASP